ncbi:MAG: carboxypeptidase-like regulatory domain-containing protein [Vicingaceae bacterium]
MKYPLLLLLLFITIPSLHAQEWIEGKVIDAQSEQPLAFVNIVFPKSGGGVNSDIDGSFRFQASANRKTIVFSYLGYQRDTLSLQEVRANSTIRLESNTYKISEVTILPGVNPAHRIIEAAIANKDKNNPEKATEFSYDSYNKLIFSAEPDSGYLNLPDSIQRNDSDSYEGLQFIEKSHMFLMESVTERNHIPPTHTKEVVKASRISGM